MTVMKAQAPLSLDQLLAVAIQFLSLMHSVHVIFLAQLRNLEENEERTKTKKCGMPLPSCYLVGSLVGSINQLL